MMLVCETDRLRLRWMTPEDAPFMHELVNDPDWLQYIGDRGIRDLDDARAFIDDRFIASYRKNGYGLFLVEQLADGVPVGISGIVSREGLDGPDVGFALLPAFRGRGYAYEASMACLDLARDQFGIERILAITHPENRESARLLEKLGLDFERLIRLPGEDQDLKLFAGSLIE